MTTRRTEERRSGADRRKQSATTQARGWLAEDVRVTRGWLLLSILVGFSFVTLAGVGAVRVISGLRRDDCLAANVRRAEAKDVALATVTGDRAIWVSIDDLFPDGIPEPARAVIFGNLDDRADKIDDVYAPERCPAG